MSLTSNIVSSLISGLGIAPGQQADANAPASKGVDDGFQALLNISGDNKPVADDAASRDQALDAQDKDKDKDRERSRDARDQNVVYPVALSVATPLLDVNTDVAVASIRSDANNDVADTQSAADAASANGPDKSSPAAGRDKVKTDSTPAKDAKDSDNSASADGAKDAAPKASASDAPTQAANGSDDEDKLRKALANQLGDINNILASIIQAFTGGAPQTQVTTAGVASVDTVSTDAFSAIATQADPSAAAISGAPATGPAVLLSDIQSTIQQLQNLLSNSPAEAQNAAQTVPLDAGAVAGSDDVNTLLEKLGNQLAQLLPQLGQGDAADDTAQTAGLPQLGALKAQLKDTIADVKSQLTQLSTQNDTLYSNTLNRLQAQLGQANIVKAPQAGDDKSNSVIKDALATIANVVSSKDKSAEPAVQIAAATSSTTAVTSSADKPQTANTLVAAAIVPSIQDGANTNTNTDSGSQQGGNSQANAAAIAGLSASSGTAAGSAASAGGSTFARALAMTGEKPLAEQVAVNIKTAASDGSSKITIQLDPEDLGKLDIKLHVRPDGKTGIVITADNSNTLNLLQRDSQSLLRSLADAGLHADSGSLSFNLRGDQQQGQQQGNQQMARSYQKAQPGEDEDTLVQTISRQYTVNLNDGLDITI